MTVIYKYGTAAGVALALIISAFFYGVHNGKLAGTAKYNALVASVDAATDKATAQAKDAQKAADAAQTAQLQAALVQAQKSVTDMQTLARIRADTIQSLTQQVNRNEQNPSVVAWSRVVIPPAAISGLCFIATSGNSTAGCDSNQGPVPPHP